MKMYDVETHVISFGYSSIVVTHLLLIAVHQRYQHSSGRKRMIHCFNLPVYNSRVELQRSLETACHTYIHGEELFIFFTRKRTQRRSCEERDPCENTFFPVLCPSFAALPSLLFLPFLLLSTWSPFFFLRYTTAVVLQKRDTINR